MLNFSWQIFATSVVVLYSLFGVSVTWASDVVPFETSNQSPFVVIFGLPTLGAAKIQENGKNELNIRLDVSNHFTEGGKGNEFLEIDGESKRLTLDYRRGLPNGLEWGVSVPFMAYDGGFLDSFILNWHNAFNLPTNGRPSLPEGRLNIQYQRDGENLVLINTERSGLGDISLHGAYQLIDGADSKLRMALRTNLKLPTGDSDKLLGSGGTDFAAWISASDNDKISRKWHWYGGAGFVLLSRGEVLADLHRDYVWFGNFGFSWHAFSILELKAQMDLHTTFYDNTQMNGLGNFGAQFVLGGTIKFSETFELDLALSEEDLNQRVAPDVTFHINLRSRF